MTSIEQFFVRFFTLCGKAFTIAKPSIDAKLTQVDKWLDSKSKS